MGVYREPVAFATTVLESAPYGFALLDAEGVVCWHTSKFASLLTHGMHPLAGSSCMALWQAADIPDFDALMTRLWSRLVADESAILRPADAPSHSLRAIGRLVEDASGQEYLMLTVKPWQLLSMLEPCDVNGVGLSQDRESTMILGAGATLSDCVILSANRVAQLQFSAEARPMGHCLGTLPGGLPQQVGLDAEVAYSKGQPFSAMYTADSDGARFVLVHWDIWPVNRQNGKITHWVDRRRISLGTPHREGEDIRWLQLAADALRATNVGVWHWDLRSGNVTFSPRLLAQLGYDEEPDGDIRSFIDGLYHPEDLPKLRHSIDEAIAGTGRFEYIARLRSITGRYHWISVRGQVIFDSDGTPVRLFGTESDVTEETLLRERLLRAERIAKIGNWSMNIEPPGMNWSPECYRLFGLDPETFRPTALHMANLLHPEDKVQLQDAMKRTIRDGAPNCGSYDRFRARIIRGDGEIRHCEFNSLCEHDDEGKTSGLVGTIQDITATIETEKRLVQAQKMEVVGQMAGGIAHDFNNLLAVVMGNLELLEEVSEQPLETELIQAAIDAAKKGAALTRNLLSFARKATLEPTRLDLNDLVHDLTKMLRRVLPTTIKIDYQCEENLWPVHADRNSFENALLNLCINARDAMDGIGQLTVTTENIELTSVCQQDGQSDLSPGTYAVVSVTDTGIGITKSQLAKIFTPFYTTKPPAKGSGLGLPMVQGFANQSGGGLRVYSTPGQGTTMKLFMPTSNVEMSAPAQRIDQKAAPKLLSGKILLVEDDTAVNQILTLQLERLGLSVTSALSGDEAIAIYPTEPHFDLVMTDIVMPGALQGPMLAERLRAIDPDLHIIFLSGYPNEEAMIGSTIRSGDIRLMKPISRAELIRAISEVLSSGANSKGET